MKNEHTDRAERCTIGSMLRDNEIIAEVVRIVRPEQFYADAHQATFRAILALWEVGKPVDVATVAEQLHTDGKSQDVGYGYLGDLWDTSPTAAHAEYYAKIVREKYILRRLVHTANEITRNCEDGKMPAAEALEHAERSVFAVAEMGADGDAVPLSEALQLAGDRMDAREARGRKGCSGLSTGLLDLDNLLSGLQPSELVIAAARPSVGKTAFGIWLMREVAWRQKVPVFFASLEQSHVEIAERMMCLHAGVDGHKLRQGYASRDDFAKLADAQRELSKAPAFIDPTPAQTMTRLMANARRYRRRHGVGLVIVDYVQLVEPENRKEARYQQVGDVSRKMKCLAKEMSVPVVALCQAGRGVDQRASGRPKLSDLRESGNLEADADTVLLFHKPEGTDGVVDVDVAKQRNGPIGGLVLSFRRHCGAFGDYIEPSPAFGDN